MPYLTSDYAINILCNRAESEGYPVGERWKLNDDWVKAHIEDPPDKHAVGVDVDGCVAWLGQMTLADGGKQWNLIALTPYGLEGYGAGDVVLISGMHNIGGKVAKMNKAQRDRTPIRPVLLNERIAGSSPDGVLWLGLCRGLDSEGLVSLVELEPNAPPVAASDIARKWYAIENRDAAFDKFWHEGPRQWPTYFGFVVKLAKTQKELKGEIKGGKDRTTAKADRAVSLLGGGVAPRLPETGKPPVDRSQPPAVGRDCTQEEYARFYAMAQEWARTGQIADTNNAMIAALWYALDWEKTQMG